MRPRQRKNPRKCLLWQCRDHAHMQGARFARSCSHAPIDQWCDVAPPVCPYDSIDYASWWWAGYRTVEAVQNRKAGKSLLANLDASMERDATGGAA